MNWGLIFGGKHTMHRRLMLLILGGNLLLGALVGAGYLWNRHVAEDARHVNRLASISHATTLLYPRLAELTDALNRALSGNLPETEFRDIIIDNLHEFEALKPHFEDLPTTVHYHGTNTYNELIGRHQRFERESAQTMTAAHLIADALRKHEIAKARQLYETHFRPAKKVLYESILALMDEAYQMAGQHNSAVIEHFDDARRVMPPLALLVLPLSLLLGLMFVNMIVRPLRDLRENMGAMVAGEGDLSAHLPDSKGEAGDVAALYNQLVDKIHKIIEQVVSAEDQLQRSSHRLLANAEQTRLGLTGQESEVEDTIAKMQALSTDILAVGRHALEAREATEDAQARSAAGREAMQHAMTVMRRLDDESVAAAQKMENLTSSAGRIAIVLDVINKLAEQTNLLALNAAIEAARAGDSGRGFAVVADEVRNLAMRTRDSTSQIGTIADEIRRQVGMSREAMNLNRHYVNQAIEQVEGVANTLMEIDTASQRIVGMSRQIAEAVTRQNDTAADIGRNSINLRMTTRQAEANAVAMESLSTELDSLVQRLYGIICAFGVVKLQPAQPRVPANEVPDLAGSDIELF